MYKAYQVKANDTLNTVAASLGVNPEDLANINGISLDTKLTPGTYLVIPSANTIFTKYIIQRGDNPYEIARRNNISLQELLKLNGLNSTDYIYPGETLLLPKPGVKFYITEQNDTLKKVTNALNTTANELNSQNEQIILLPDQLIIFKTSGR